MNESSERGEALQVVCIFASSNVFFVAHAHPPHLFMFGGLETLLTNCPIVTKHCKLYVFVYFSYRSVALP